MFGAKGNMDTLMFIAEVIKAIAWPAVVLTILLLLRKALGAKVAELIEIQTEGKSLRALFSGPQRAAAALPPPGQTVISQEEVREALLKSPLLKQADVERDFAQAHTQFLRNGIVTSQQLQQLLTSEAIAQILKEIYVTELFRPEDKPLDPVGLAIFGSLLYGFGTGRAVVSAVREQIRHSPEYREKH